jgi:ABC-type polysaccharide/polyol phosphate export permease
MTMSLVLGLGIEYSTLFHQPVQNLLPYVAIGLVTWGFLSSAISEGADAFVSGAAMIKQSSLPLPLFTLRVLIRNGINLGHQIVIVIAVLAWFRVFPGPGMLWALPGLAIVVVNLGWLGLLLAMICSRFRDMPQIVAAVLQLVFFLSPIFWIPTPELITSPFVAANPFYFAVESVRGPLLHGEPPGSSLAYLAIIAAVGWTATLLVYNQTRRRVVHYL